MPALNHRWDLTPKEAVALQKELRERVLLRPLEKPIRYIAGVDVSLNLYSTTVFAGWIVLSYPDLVVVDETVVRAEVTFPYVPGLLSFREVPPLLEAWKKLKIRPDVALVDGVGIAHPRRLGIATHLGLALDLPTVGCAKSLLTGVYQEPPQERGSFTYQYPSAGSDEIIGAVVRTKPKVKPMFISPGNAITLQESIDLVLSCVRRHQMPEPTRLAHELTNRERRAFYGLPAKPERV